MKYALTFLLFLAAQTLSFADSIAYTIVGVLPSGIQTSSISQPDAPFTLTFSIPRHPVAVLPGINGSEFSTTTVAVFTSGSTGSVIQNAQIGFYTSRLGGGLFARLFNGTDLLNFSLGGLTLFSGTAANPTLLDGYFLMDAGLYSGVGLNRKYDAITHIFYRPTPLMARVVGVPEPGETMLGGAALALAIFASRLLRDRASYRLAPGKRTSSSVSANTNSSK